MAIAKTMRDRLLAVIELGLRPGSPGERQAAESAIGRLILSHADAIRALLAREPSALSPPSPGYDEPEQDDPLDRFESWREAVRYCLRCAGDLSRWEEEFLSSVLRYRYRPSDRQLDVLRCITSRTMGAMA